MFRKVLKAIVDWGVKNLTKLSNRLNRTSISNPYFLDDLSPIDNIENGDPYFKSLEWALGNTDIHNIAVTGPYGSGKSSVIKSFEKTHPEYHYLKISLASFRDGTTHNVQKQASDNNDEHRLVEISILQQIFYKVKAKEIPDSRFKRIRRLSKVQLSFYAGLIVSSIVSLIILLNPAFLNNFSGWEKLSPKQLSILKYLAGGILLTGIILFSIYLLRFFSSKQFEKVSISSGEIAIKEDNEKSILNKHLDEILYFFQATSYNVVIIEDLDRFKDHEIFTKLREINTLLNQSNQVNRKIVFIYALKDDMFLDKTRTKFFEFILPVIPVVNWTNSYAILLKRIKESKLELELDERFISDITFFIDDMRILKNIFNEFIIYKENLKNLALNHNKLLGIVIYKNMYPTDFSLLHEKKGLVHGAFKEKESCKLVYLEKIESRIKSLKSDILQANQSHLNNIQELRTLYIHKIIEVKPSTRAFQIKKNRISLPDIKKDENFNILKHENPIQIYYDDYSTSSTGKSFEEIEKLIDKTASYDERAQVIENKKEENLKEFQKELENLSIQKSRIQSYSLKEFVDSFPEAIEKLTVEFKEDDFLIYLIREGYIDEMYSSFISYFYEGGPTQSDMDYILSIKNQKPLDSSLALSKFPEILKKVTALELRRDAAINYSLTDFLLQNSHSYATEYNSYFSQFAAKNSRHMEFFLSYLKSGSYKDLFIKAASDYWPDFVETIYSNKTLTNQFKDSILRLIILNISSSKLPDLNKELFLSEYISNKPDFFSLIPEQHNIVQVKAALKKLNVKFKNLELIDVNPDLFDHVYEKNLYELNPGMISLMVEKKHNDKIELTHLNSQNLTTIQKSGCTTLISYINTHLEEYLSNVFLLLENNKEENTEVVENLLINENLKQEIRQAIIEKEECLLPHLYVIPETLWETVLKNRRMIVNWDNVMIYFAESTNIDLTLAEYLNNKNNYTELSKYKIGFIDEEDQEAADLLSSTLCKELIFSRAITDESFDCLVDAIGDTYNGDLDLTSITDRRKTTLINTETLVLSPDNFTALSSPELKNLLLKKNITAFLEEFENYSIDASQFILLLKSDITREHKLSVITKLEPDLITEKSGLADIICSIIMHPFTDVGYEKLTKLIAHTNDPNTRIALLTKSLPQKTIEQIDELLNLMNEPFSLLTDRGKRPTIPFTTENFEIARILHDMGYISSYKIENETKIRIINKPPESDYLPPMS